MFAFDPTLGVELDTVRINETTLSVTWERDADGRELLETGPAGEYVEVIDRDPASGCSYAPLDLNDPRLLAQDGLPPSESNPQFHQQMVYAVSMRTIQTFERALGRPALWSPRREATKVRGKTSYHEAYVRRLRLYPHALREGNAYYSPDKKAVLFGYFPAPAAAGPTTARLTVFTCLSHDIIAHEVTHALLDGMHRRFNEPSNADVLAFHEAFADLVALFLHFSIPQVLRHQIAATRGDLSSQNRLGELAQQFGQAIGQRGALRSAIGRVDAKGHWSTLDPDPEALSKTNEPHERGAILVAAVFDAFLTMYKARVADLLRIASEGTGVLPTGQLHPDLVNRMAEEAADASQNVLDMCIRALDYCPPVDLTFGDYLRAIMTADFEFNPVDERHQRVAFVEAFRRRGIVPEGVRTLSVDGLLWRPTSAAPDEDEDVVLDFVKDWSKDIGSWKLSKSREALHDLMRDRREALHKYLSKKFSSGVRISGIDPKRPFEVHSIRPSMRSDWEGRPRFQWIVELTQRLPQFLDPADAKKRGAVPDYYFRGGCTLFSKQTRARSATRFASGSTRRGANGSGSTTRRPATRAWRRRTLAASRPRTTSPSPCCIDSDGRHLFASRARADVPAGPRRLLPPDVSARREARARPHRLRRAERHRGCRTTHAHRRRRHRQDHRRRARRAGGDARALGSSFRVSAGRRHSRQADRARGVAGLDRGSGSRTRQRAPEAPGAREEGRRESRPEVDDGRRPRRAADGGARQRAARFLRRPRRRRRHRAARRPPARWTG